MPDNTHCGAENPSPRNDENQNMYVDSVVYGGVVELLTMVQH